jgi:hypothetical protein
MIDIQTAAAYAAIAGAIAYVGKEMWTQLAPLRKKSNSSSETLCGGCGVCGGKRFKNPMIQLKTLPPRSDRTKAEDN